MADLPPENPIQAEDGSAGRRTSRRVARLSSQQVQHKRNLDRTSQQAYRQRIKSRVKDLEDELSRLKADRGSSQETLLRKIQTLHTENRELKGRLKKIQQLAAAEESHSSDSLQHDDLHSSALTDNGDGDAAPVQLEIQTRPPDDQEMATNAQNYKPSIQMDLSQQGQPHSSVFSNGSDRSDVYMHNDDTNVHDEPRTSQPKVIPNAHVQSSPHSNINALQEEILLTFGDVALPEKLAFMFVMFRNMRWQLSSSKHDYEAMPRWLRPTALQITAPHSAWIDNLPWPHMRDLLIEDPQKYPYSTFSELYSPHVSVNWPYDPMDTVLMVGNDMVLNPIFEKHIQRLENWKVSGPFCETLPELAAVTYR
ncbi:hypothetical protein N7462_006614 [Penicillium macrosclerotiorum]|uniref:uncharacterized protein n=1 Tax=Penicillium macrosclerotiorum TaxID=303699 RepID=UPI00254914D4|nr:uncharacterized protein N7462_006614 [Penicillium macrosclerotiorum]KAJ5683449.1 hypothetical protein N7462_006614 [Penicillium macrosclerotiorum]